VVLVTDENVLRLHERVVSELTALSGATSGPHVLRPGEASKSAVELERLWDRFAAERLDRTGLVVAVGGGVVSDLAGFAAGTWMRGIRWGAIPTTTEAVVDASVGGKTSINRPAGKNLVGLFHQPSFVLVDLSLLRTLPKRDRLAGLGESVKHALVADESLFAWHEAHTAGILAGEDALWEELIARNCRIKASVVEADERETKGLRECLNFGHTIGHAVEQELGYELRHGECVSLGMIAAARIAGGRGLVNRAEESRLRSLVKALELPTALPRAVATERIIELIDMDKKVRGGRRRFVLLKGIGRYRMVDDVTEQEIEAGLEVIS
jgi:3-dehydroquinate synthase